jgi:hypothetical protein
MEQYLASGPHFFNAEKMIGKLRHRELVFIGADNTYEDERWK